MHSTEAIPEQVFELLAQKNFESLADSERELVLGYLNAEEYNDMSLAASMLDSGNSGSRKAQLLERFDRAHSAKVVTLRKSPRVLAAAAALVILLSLARYLLLNPARTSHVVAGVIADTIYIEKEVYVDRVVRATDTVYLKERQNTVAGPEKVATVANTSAAKDFETLSVSESENEANEIKGNSLLYDSLWRRFEAITL